MTSSNTVSLAFEGLCGAGKTTTIKKIAQSINLSNRRVWMGLGHSYSFRRSAGYSPQGWAQFRSKTFIELEKHCDILLLERCVVADFQKLCFRRNMIEAAELWRFNQDWLPSFTIVIKPPVETCVSRVIHRGDVFRADSEDLQEFDSTLAEAIEYLSPLMGERLIVVPTGEEAVDISAEILAGRGHLWT